MRSWPIASWEVERRAMRAIPNVQPATCRDNSPLRKKARPRAFPRKSKKSSLQIVNLTYFFFLLHFFFLLEHLDGSVVAYYIILAQVQQQPCLLQASSVSMKLSWSPPKPASQDDPDPISEASGQPFFQRHLSIHTGCLDSLIRSNVMNVCFLGSTVWASF